MTRFATPHDIVVGRWGVRFRGRRFPASIGRSGVSAAKREGDGATPVGVHGLVGMLYRPDRMARPVRCALPISPGDLWSDDARDEDYNLMVRLPHRFSHERLWRADPQYDLVLLTNWNWPHAVPGKGSAIFLHQWRRAGQPTAGCVAFRRDHLRWIATRIRPQTRVIVKG